MKGYKTVKEVCAIAGISKVALYQRISAYEAEGTEIPREYSTGGVRVFNGVVAGMLISPPKRKLGRKRKHEVNT